MTTSRNTRGIDIVAYNGNGTNFIGIQVKTLAKRDAVIIGNSLDKVMGDYWIIVNNAANEPNAFIMRPDEVKTRARRGGKKDNLYWLLRTSYDKPEFKEAWHRIVYGHEIA